MKSVLTSTPEGKSTSPYFGDKILVRIAGRHIPIGVVRVVIRRHVARIGVKNRNNLSRGVPIGDVALNELKVENGNGRSPFLLPLVLREYRYEAVSLNWACLVP